MSPAVSKAFEIGAAIAIPIIAGAIAYGAVQAQVANHSANIIQHSTRIGAIEVNLARQDARWEAIRETLNEIKAQVKGNNP